MDEARGPEDRIEHIVREAEGAAQFEFNPAAWSAMEAQLDAAAPVPFSWWKILFPIAGTAVLLTLLLWPMAASDLERVEGTLSKQRATKEQAIEADKATTSEKQTAAVEQEVPSTEAGNPQSAENTLTPTENDGSEASDQSTALIKNSDKRTEQPNAAGTVKNNGEEAVQAELTNSNIKVKELVEKVDEQKTNGTESLDTYRYRAAVEQDVVNSVTSGEEKSQEVLGGSVEADAESEIVAAFLRWEPTELSFPGPHLIFQVDSSMYSKEMPDVSYFERSRWAFSLALSADLSATGLEGFTDPGTMIGFGVEYYFANKWSIQTGATYAVKKYTALGEEYRTPDWISARPDDLLSASAICRVVDIPFNIRKYFQNKKGNTFFVSTGVSTYLMLREDYNYEYSEERPGWAPFWRYENRNNHFFGILNLSLGFEKPLGKKFALGIEPFMKLPLTGIGEGRVRFLSFGTNIAIKLRK